MIYPFVESPASIESIEGSAAVRLLRALERENGNVKKLTEDEKELIETVFGELWHPDTYTQGIAKIGGYIVDFRPFLKSYWVKTRYYGIREIKAFNKTYIRKLSTTPSEIIKIVEIDGNEEE